jgi:hypothetical protein
MRRQEGAAGYGIYVMLLELIRDSEDQQLYDDPESIAFALHEDDIALITRVCHDYSLFTLTDDEHLQSPFLAMCQQQADERAAKAREWGLKGAKARYSRNSAQQSTPQTTPDPPEPVRQSNALHGDKPYTLPMGGGMGSPCINQTKQTIIDQKENNQPTTKSKLVALEWLGLSGADWLELCSSPDLMREPEALRILDLPPVAGRNPAILVDWIRQFGLPKKLYGTLQTLSGDWRVDSPVFQAIFAVVKHVRDTKYRPAHPAQYLISTAIKFYNQV